MSRNERSSTDDLLAIRGRVHRCVAVVMLGFTAATYYHYWLAAYDGAEYPASTWLYRPSDGMGVAWTGVSKRHCFGDFFGPWLVAQEDSPYVAMPYGFGSNYLPLAHVFMIPVRHVPYSALLPVYLAMLGAFVFLLFMAALRPLPPAERVIAATAMALMSYPTQILLDRGNIESFVFVFLCAFLFCFSSHRPMLAAACLAAAIAIKGYPAVFGLLFLNRGRIKPLIATGILTAIFTFVAAACFGGGALQTLAAFLDGASHYMSSKRSDDSIIAGSSVWGLLVITSCFCERIPFVFQGALWTVRNFYVVQLAMAFGLTGLFLCVRFRVWEAFALCCFAMMSLLAVAPDYRLIHWFIPIVAFFRVARPVHRQATYAVLFGLLLIPKGVVLAGEARWSAFFNPMLMLAIVGLIVFDAARRPTNHPRPWVVIVRQLSDFFRRSTTTGRVEGGKW